MKTLIVVPTYNEAGNIDSLIQRVLNFSFPDILIVDDNSQDGTLDNVKTWVDTTRRVQYIQRQAKLGLGTAYITGFAWGLKRGYELFFEMDADNSHNPETIPFFVKKIQEGNDVVVGSRYIGNTISVVGWDFRRLLISKFGNLYASTLLGIRQFTDLTSGYRCYTRHALEMIGLDNIHSNGYAFQIEMVYRAYNAGLRIAEIPIIFYERDGGSSKMSKKIVREAVLLPFKLMLKKD